MQGLEPMEESGISVSNINGSNPGQLILPTSSVISDQDDTSPNSPAEEPNFDDTEEANRCRTCEIINPWKSRYMVKCDSCSFWFHYSCVCLMGEQARKLRNWFCPTCLHPDTVSENPTITPPDMTVPTDIAAELYKLKKSTHLYQRLPKPVRSPLTSILAERIDDVLNNPSPSTWWLLFLFPYNFLQVKRAEAGQENITTTKVIRQNINNTDSTTQEIERFLTAFAGHTP